ncbi:ABC transporter permease [Curtobacterium sp. MCBD17_040]|uniref:ABC transporter permease n=1 Tax=Curtobacterium sp. MCBD17_040 TaxID=2175674 RepID=UPI0021ACA6B6|nr:ABC transporter permease [Curtobacterium sp. MCBD17_040]WIB63084.1 ABC transporter permease [Curtobacterium sp. MCBD17_040]
MSTSIPSTPVRATDTAATSPTDDALTAPVPLRTRGRLPIRYVALEAKRQLRNVRSLVFTIAVPVVMLLAFGSAYGSSGQVDPATKLPWLVVTTLQMASYGAMMAALGQAFTIVTERSIGWNRQLRITPLSGVGFLVSKVIAAMAVAALGIVVVTLVSVLALHADLAPGRWLVAGVGVWAGVVPFALIAILIGQFARPSFAQPLFMVVFMGLAILGGLWVPLSIMPAWMSTLAHGVPSYWLDRMGQMGAGADGSMLEPALVLAAWAFGLAAVVVWRYRRDAARQ